MLLAAAATATLTLIVTSTALGTSAALASPLPAPAISQVAADTAPAALSAPDGTAEIWIDIEGAEAREAIEQIGSFSESVWTDAAATVLPFGAAARFAATAGTHDVRIALPATLNAAFRADLAVTYVDTAGNVLGEATLRDMLITPGLADADGWVTWAAIVGAPDNSGSPSGNADGSDADSSDTDSADADGADTAGTGSSAEGAAASGSDSSGDASGTNNGSLSVTGATAPWLIIGGAVVLIGAGTAIAVAARRTRSRAANDGQQPNEDVSGSGMNADADTNTSAQED